MYFHVLIEINEKFGKLNENKIYSVLDITDICEIEKRVVEPFVLGEDFQFDGYFLTKKDIRRVAIKESQKSTEYLSKYENDNLPAGVFMFVSPVDIVGYKKHTKDITDEVFGRVKASLINSAVTSVSKRKLEMDKSKVFIVHGRDDLAKVSAARFIEKLGLSAVILHEQITGGKTIIEKFEEHTNVGFAVVLYTPCDIGGLAGDPSKPRARQNVVFEHGYLIAKLGRRNVCALVKSGVEVPNDISGVVYVALDDHGAWNIEIAKELRNAGYNIDMNRVV